MAESELEQASNLNNSKIHIMRKPKARGRSAIGRQRQRATKRRADGAELRLPVESLPSQEVSTPHSADLHGNKIKQCRQR